MSKGYPFVAVVKSVESGSFVSVQALENEGATQELISAIVHGPIEQARSLMVEWNIKFFVEENQRVKYEE